MQGSSFMYAGQWGLRSPCAAMAALGVAEGGAIRGECWEWAKLELLFTPYLDESDYIS
jgi:hypothetical protein